MIPRSIARVFVPVLAIASLTSAVALAQDSAEDPEIITRSWYSEWDEAKYAEPFEHLDYVNPNAPKGGDVTIGMVGTFDSMNPFSTLSGTPAALSSSMYERLMSGTADEFKSALYCVLCETIEYPKSKDWVIFHLRHDVTFSDGAPMTAEDVAFTHNKMIAEATPSWRSGVSAMIKEVEALDPYTVKFTFQPDIPRNGLIDQAGATPVMQKAWFEKTGAKLDEKRYETSPGTGAYMLSNYDPGQWVEYKRNPDYWGAAHPMNVGRNNLDTIRVVYFGDTVAAFEAFKAGDITFRQENSSLQWATGYDFPALDKGWVTKETLHNGNIPPAYGFVFNLRREKFQDRNVRLALGLMYNFTWTNDTLQYGLFSQRVSMWQSPGLMAEGLPEGAELEILNGVKDDLPEAIFTEEAFVPHSSGERSLDRKNMRRAIALLAEAGYAPGDDGMMRDAEGKTLDVEVLQYSPSWDRIMKPYVENLVALGVNASYNRIDPNQYQARTQSNDFDMIYDGYANGFEEGSSFTQKYGCADKEDVFNPAGYCNPAIDKIGDEILKVKTYDEMSAMVRAADRIMRYDYFIVPAHMNDSYWVAYYDMYEHPEADKMPPLALGYLDFWWVNQEREAELRAAGALK
ncbi:extracellular solute-binding protein [Celeribacter neptunius]|uniref:Microcin C transport system substrate-binding protein n=1 Tax=Celeribacter neptunius TaxID=588602 RepID=A0A1I3UTX8_9RHOB|nr:extracellular solute-binding protein [Celeribacter neptunius]SFJ85536.1 microcin C transport system substrate-binding protein [Celeribacter neptunius]